MELLEKQKESLQNFASKFGLKVHIRHENDKRKKPKFFVVKDTTISSPCLSYDNLNNFLLGVNVAVKHNLQISK